MSQELLALDFDGVLCDGLQEYFQVAWETYDLLWRGGMDPQAPAGSSLFDGFARGRPVIETGWEMPFLVWALDRGLAVAELLDNWPGQLAQLQTIEGCPARGLVAQTLDGVRDRWIATQPKQWLGLHRFYPGVLGVLRQRLTQGDPVAIVSTKEGRFIAELLQRQGVEMPRAWIVGKEVKQPKGETLRQWLNPQTAQDLNWPPLTQIHFVEDRLAALQAVGDDPTLGLVRLYLATWGYNLDRDHRAARQDDRITTLSLTQFCQVTWP